MRRQNIVVEICSRIPPVTCLRRIPSVSGLAFKPTPLQPVDQQVLAGPYPPRIYPPPHHTHTHNISPFPTRKATAPESRAPIVLFRYRGIVIVTTVIDAKNKRVLNFYLWRWQTETPRPAAASASATTVTNGLSSWCNIVYPGGTNGRWRAGVPKTDPHVSITIFTVSKNYCRPVDYDFSAVGSSSVLSGGDKFIGEQKRLIIKCFA